MTSSNRDSDDGAESHSLDHGHADHDHEQDHSHGGPEAADRAVATDNERVVQFVVPDMDCPSCAGKVENSVKTLDGTNEIGPQITTGTLSVSYDETQMTADTISDRIEKAGYTVENDDEVTVKFTAPEMDCPSCAGRIENALNGVLGISTYDTQPTTGKVLVTYDSTTVTESEIITAIEDAGYEVIETSGESNSTSESGESQESIWTSSRAIKTWISGGFVALGLLFEFVLTGQNLQVASVVGSNLLVADLLFLIAIAVGAKRSSGTGTTRRETATSTLTS